MDTRTTFLNACNEIANRLGGFKAIEKGQRLKKNATDKDIHFEIYFQSSFRNDASSIQVIPHIRIYSKTLKKWQIEQTKNQFNQGEIYGNQLGYLTPFNNWWEWNVAKLNFEKSVNQIAQNIEKYVFPIFEIFDTKETAIEFLKNNGTKRNKWSQNSLFFLDFLLCFSEKELAQTLLSQFVENCTNKESIFKLYEQLKTETHINLNHSEFWGANKIRLAYVNGLKINVG